LDVWRERKGSSLQRRFSKLATYFRDPGSKGGGQAGLGGVGLGVLPEAARRPGGRGGEEES
jgi:hypothetical protein